MMVALTAVAAAALVPAGGLVPPSALPVPGTMTIAPATGPALSVETGRVFDEAVQRAASRAGFTLLPGQDHGRYTAQVTVTRTSRGLVAAGRPDTPAPLASLSGSVSLSLPPAGTRYSELAVTELKVVIARRVDGRTIWSGSAVTARASSSRSGSIDVVARTLANAVLSQFPGQADGPISIP